MKYLLSLLFLTIMANAIAQSFTIPADNNFYHPEIGSIRQTISGPDSSNDNGKAIQAAIDEVSSNGGGIVRIEASANNRIFNIVDEIHIKSGVHIRVAPNVVFQSDNNTKATLFSAGKTGDQRVSNFSVACTEADKYFSFDFSERIAGERDGGAIAIAIGGVDNFRIGDFVVRDNYTTYSCVTVNLLDYNLDGITKYMFAQNGIIENIVSYTGHYGYGTVQCQAAKNILYRNLTGEGGAALRLETGAVCKENLVDRTIRIDSVYAKNIKCTNGQSAVTLSPHTVNNGVVFIDSVTAIGCECGAVVAAGFLSAKKKQRDEDGNAINGYVYGWFDSNSIISNMRVVYGTNAQLRPQRRVFVPCSQKYLISATKNPDNESYKGPTVAGIVYYAKAGTTRELGHYSVNMPGLKMENFPEKNGIMENKEYVVSEKKDGFKNCIETGIEEGLLKKNK